MRGVVRLAEISFSQAQPGEHRGGQPGEARPAVERAPLLVLLARRYGDRQNPVGPEPLDLGTDSPYPCWSWLFLTTSGAWPCRMYRRLTSYFAEPLREGLNKEFPLPRCEMWHFDWSGRVVGGDLCYDQVSLLTQLGLMPQQSRA
jgi:hypothetical protein